MIAFAVARGAMAQFDAGGPCSFMAARRRSPGNVMDPSAPPTLWLTTLTTRCLQQDDERGSILASRIVAEAWRGLSGGRHVLHHDRGGGWISRDVPCPHVAGLAVIDEPGLSAVRNDGISRVKVVNAIQWCQRPGTNISLRLIGAPDVLVRMSRSRRSRPVLHESPQRRPFARVTNES